MKIEESPTLLSIQAFNAAEVQVLGIFSLCGGCLNGGTGIRSNSAYRNVFFVGLTSTIFGLTQATTAVLQCLYPFVSNTCFNTFVKVLCRYGICTGFDFTSSSACCIYHNVRPRMQSFSVDNETWISRDSFIRSLECSLVSAATSLPARSIRKSKPSGESKTSLFTIRMRHTAWVRDELSFLRVGALFRKVMLRSMSSRSSSAELTLGSRAPTSWDSPKLSCMTLILRRSLSKSVCISRSYNSMKRCAYLMLYCQPNRRRTHRYLGYLPDQRKDPSQLSVPKHRV